MDSTFTQFIGQKVLVNKTEEIVKIGDDDYPIADYKVASEDTTVASLRKALGDFRLWLPGTMGTMDFRTDRLNVRVEEQPDGSFEVTRIYHG